MTLPGRKSVPSQVDIQKQEKDGRHTATDYN